MTQKRADVRDDLASEFRDLCAERQVPQAAVTYALLTRAVAAVIAGDATALPAVGPGGRAPRRPGVTVTAVKWSQGDAEYSDYRRILQRAGTSLNAVVGSGVEAYVEAGGDLARMSWPRSRALSDVA